eukprot:CAMPEP_0194750052 /NCGR_PEP_ID=MMETSP0323_2-20130528/4086_1 /TAXON_ID=2866 ORGANISM="Crypthecodinium cohnii, Strain Seligo" /NCGR_SAMPLE_ID=MMETSP0323_2 /ASSEMBLY_ACC=CAM_ASM_000346 /LENGTH=38 /DNA_ID= /DNA_START= /DNA_END= /DNA_ORIENTATION=
MTYRAHLGDGQGPSAYHLASTGSKSHRKAMSRVQEYST